MMVDLIGMKRLMALAVLLLISVVLGAFVYLYMVPKTQQQDVELRRLHKSIKALGKDVDSFQMEFDQLEQSQSAFENLQVSGFLSAQNRREAEEALEKVQAISEVVSASVNISPGVLQKDQQAKKAKHDVLKSDVNIQIEAIEDADVYSYIYFINEFFPGHLAVKNVDIERVKNVTGTTLKEISSNQNPVLVKARVDLIWSTMISLQDNVQNEQGVR